MDKKNHAFAYVVQLLIEWHKEESKKKGLSENSYQKALTKLPLMKLLFFLCSASVKGSDKGLFRLFTNFKALPFGHVEQDILDAINSDQIPGYHISADELKERPKGELDFNESLLKDCLGDGLEKNCTTVIKDSLDLLKSKNEGLVLQSAAYLIELSHQRDSWRFTFGWARRNQKYSEKISDDLMIKEYKSYSLVSAT